MVASICENMKICLVRMSLKSIVTIKIGLNVYRSSKINDIDTDCKIKRDILHECH